MNGRVVAIGAGLLLAGIAAAIGWGLRGTTSPTPAEPARLPAAEPRKPPRRAPIGVTSGTVAVSGRAVDEHGAHA